MLTSATFLQWMLGFFLIVSAVGVVSLRKPIYASLSFLATLLFLAALYLSLSAEFIAVMQILVYAGAILVIFVFVIVLFQDAHAQIERFAANCSPLFLISSGLAFVGGLSLLGIQLMRINLVKNQLPEGFGQVQGIGKALYLDFFFPFEALILLFLVAIIGAIYMAKKE